MYVHNTVVCSSLIQVSLYINQVVRTAEKNGLHYSNYVLHYSNYVLHYSNYVFLWFST